MLFARSAKYCALLAALVLPACSGGGMAKGIAIPQFESGTLALTFAAPAKTTTSHKQRTFLSPSTASISVTISGVATPVVANVASGSPNCTTTGSGRTCTIAIGAAPVGTDTFAITLYDGANATGNVLGTGSVASAVVSGTPFSAAVVADGIPGSIAISAGQTSFATGTAATTALTVAAQDVDGNTISGTYASPITLTNSDTTGAFTLSPATVTSSSQTVTLSYNGSAAVTADTISANVAGAKALNVTIQVTVSNATLPSPTASVSPSPTPRSSPSSTASPSASAIPSPTPSPTAPPSPSPSPTASPSPSPSPSAIPSPSPIPSPTSAATIACNTPNPCQIYLSDPDAPGFMAGSNIAMVTPTETGYTGNFTWSPTVAGQTTQDCAALVNPSLSSSFTYTSAFTESPQTGTTFTFTQTQNVLAFDPGAYSGGVLASCDGTISDANGNTTILTIFLQGVGTM